MPTSSRAPDILVDTSMAVSLCVADHESHRHASAALDGRRLGSAGHAAFESFSVLTGLAPPARRSPAIVARLLRENFPASQFLSADGASQLLARLSQGEIAGGAVVDALVGATAMEHQLPLATIDRRAPDTYRVLGVEVELLGTSG